MNEHGIKLTRYLAAKIMRSMGLISCQLKTHKYKRADEEHQAHDNILNRNFSPSAPNQVWTGDVTYIRIKGGWCYLAVVLDLYARRVVGFSVSDSPDSVLTIKALQMAYQTRLKSQVACCFTLIKEPITLARSLLNPWRVVRV